jgi:dihydrofolate synthase/folylpolyglutamate synthase
MISRQEPDDYAEALRELYALAGRGIDPGLGRVRAALEAVGGPERGLRVVHVAGTNGKGSVSAMVATGLAAAGHRVGLYTSPHLSAFIERMRVLGGASIERRELVAAWKTLREPLARVPGITFFEAVTVLALWLFARREVDLAVLEVGLGGRLDATNVIARPRVCAITRIGLDHQRYLGSDLASIAREKAGILKPDVPVVVGAQDEEAGEAIARVAASVGSPLVRVGVELEVDGPDEGLTVRAPRATFGPLRPRLLGRHQRENVAVAVGVLAELEAQGISVDVRAAVEQVEWPGRLERIELVRGEHAGRYLLDAAHNVDGAEALAAHLAATRGARRVLLFGAMADKDWRAMLPVLRPHVDAMVFAAPELSRAEAPAVLAEALGGVPAEGLERALATARALAGEGGEVVIAGSIYLMGELRGRLLGLERDPPIAM